MSWCLDNEISEREVSREKAKIQIPRAELQKLSASSGIGDYLQSDPLLRRIQAQKAEAVPQIRPGNQNPQMVSEAVVTYVHKGGMHDMILDLSG